MKFGWNRYFFWVMLLGMAFSHCGCGGGSASGGDGTGTFITGKISFANGSPGDSTTVKLYKTSYTIYSTSTISGKLYTTRNASGVDTIPAITADSQVFQQTATGVNGVYTLTGVPSGKYTIVPSRLGYLFKSVQIPTLDRSGVLTITDSGTVYLYNPEGTGNQITPDGKIIYNSVPINIADHLLSGQDFEISLPGGA